MSQCDRLLKLFERGESITSLESYNTLGITQLGTRLSDLKEIGYDIRSEWIEVQNRFNESCRVKRYWLHLPEVGVMTNRSEIIEPTSVNSAVQQQSFLEPVSTMGGM